MIMMMISIGHCKSKMIMNIKVFVRSVKMKTAYSLRADDIGVGLSFNCLGIVQNWIYSSSLHVHGIRFSSLSTVRLLAFLSNHLS